MNRAVLLLVLTALISCGSEPRETPTTSPTPGATTPTSQVDQVVPLEEGAVRGLLIDSAIIDGHMSYTYCPNNNVRVVGARGPYSLFYTIEGNEVCHAPGRRCFTLYRRDDDIVARNFSKNELERLTIMPSRC